MISKLTSEQTQALHASGNRPLSVLDPTTNHVYVLVDQETHLQAMEALRQRDDAESIQRGIADLEAGRHQPAVEAFANLRANFNAKYGE